VPMPGEIKAYCSETVPPGWLLCDGSSCNTVEKLRLFKILGYKYGGQGETFNLPDLRDRMLLGAGRRPNDTLRTIGQNSAKGMSASDEPEGSVVVTFLIKD